jgi:hypothetical protein
MLNKLKIELSADSGLRSIYFATNINPYFSSDSHLGSRALFSYTIGKKGSPRIISAKIGLNGKIVDENVFIFFITLNRLA